MKTDFSINVQVNLGVTPELVQLVSAILSHKPTIVQSDEALLVAHAQVEEKPEDTAPAAPAAPQQPTTKRGRKKKEEAAADTKEQPSNNESEAAGNGNRSNANNEPDTNTNTEGQAPQGEAATEQAQAPKELTEEDVRAAMHKTRQRIEGEDYKEHTDGDAYKKYHKALTAQFKNIAALLGADKPSALPTEQRANFIKQCDELQVLEDGTIGTKCPY